jgi:putative transposase
MSFISQAGHEKSIAVDGLCSAMNISRATYYRHLEGLNKTRPVLSPVYAFTYLEKQRVLDLLHSERFIDKTPYDVFYELLDKGEYHCSLRTMYRILAEQGESKERRVQRNHRDAVKPELMATRPNEV